MLEYLTYCFINGTWILLHIVNGFLLYHLCAPFLQIKNGLRWKVFLVLLFGGSSGMVIWVGDNNLLFTLPVFLGIFLFCTRGDLLGRLSICLIFFCLLMSICAILDTYLGFLDDYDILSRLGRTVVYGLLYLFFRRKLPQSPVHLARPLWKLIFGLSAMPLCALVAVVLLTHQKHDSIMVHSVAMNQGLVVLPFVLLTALTLLQAILTLADHEQLERTAQLAVTREVYYQGLQHEQTQVRSLRHDLQNHLTVLYGLLEQDNTHQAMEYLEQIAGSPALKGTKRLCDNEVANVVLSSKAETAQRLGLTADFQISLPKELTMADTDLCALLGNALDNAIEAAQETHDKQIRVRCRADKGLFMLQVDNALTGKEKPDLSTTKSDKRSHGFGLTGMREIATRYGGSLEAGPINGRFELVVCLPL